MCNEDGRWSEGSRGGRGARADAGPACRLPMESTPRAAGRCGRYAARWASPPSWRPPMPTPGATAGGREPRDVRPRETQILGRHRLRSFTREHGDLQPPAADSRYAIVNSGSWAIEPAPMAQGILFVGYGSYRFRWKAAASRGPSSSAWPPVYTAPISVGPNDGRSSQ